MIISVKVVKKPRCLKKCPMCCKKIDGPVISLYGSAFRGETPYRMHVHPECTGKGETKQEQEKIAVALAIAKK